MGMHCGNESIAGAARGFICSHSHQHEFWGVLCTTTTIGTVTYFGGPESSGSLVHPSSQHCHLVLLMECGACVDLEPYPSF